MLRHALGGTRALRDGFDHAWQNTGRTSSDALKPGAAHVEATLMELRPQDGLPVSGFHAVQQRDVTSTEG